MDKYIPTPRRDSDLPFLMPVEDVFSIKGRGTVVTGRIERGTVKLGEQVEIVGLRELQNTTVTGIQMFHKLVEEGRAGDNVGILLGDLKRTEVERGQVLAKPGSITPHIKFEAEVYVLHKDEGGRYTPFCNGYRPQFYIRMIHVTCTISLPVKVELVMPGDYMTMTLELTIPVALCKGTHFTIREGGRTVGAGVVTKIIE